MHSTKKGIAILLIFSMIATFLPFAAFAQVDEDSVDTIIYNLGEEDITVGSDVIQAEETPWSYKLFAADGNYTIEAEENAFFPYEVQFTYNDVVEKVWFETPDSTVEIGGHVFSIYSEQTDASQLSQLGVWIGDNYVAAYPEEKAFSSTPSMMTFSLLPLQEKILTIDLNGYTPAELRMVKVSTIFSDGVLDGNETLFYAKQGDDFQAVTAEDNLDVLASWYTTWQFIVGSGNQLDTNNIRYLVRFTNVDAGADWLIPEVSLQDAAEQRTPVEIYTKNYYSETQEISRLQIAVAPVFDYDEKIWLGLSLDPELTADRNLTAIIYKGTFSTPEEAEEAAQKDPTIDITSQIWNQTMENKDAGYKANYTDYNDQQNSFTVVLLKDNNIVGIDRITINIYPNSNSVSPRGVYLRNDSRNINVVENTEYDVMPNVDRVVTYTLKPGYSANTMYDLFLQYSSKGTVEGVATNIEKAVVGHYDTLEDAKQQTDIKDQLFPGDPWTAGTKGYNANYSGNGVNFTVFTKAGEVFKLTVKAKDGAESEENLGELLSGDSYFQAKGIAGQNQVYVMDFQHDSYYENGYQTLFLLDENADLSNVALLFEKAAKANIFANGNLQETGKTVQDFSQAAIQYSASAEDGRHLKNYWVTVAKQHKGGAKLFVNGANVKNENGEVVREIFLNDDYDFHHDIFIANIGDAAMTGIKAELSADSQNVRLDDYWTVGGQNNNTLAAFTNVNGGTVYGELANVAKIRLLPDGDGVISGTLTISADEQEPVVIKLTGVAGNPKIVTTELPQAVKYVPYASLIQTNNQYDWNQVTFKLVNGNLPAGMELKPNGEVYGVPTEIGEFNFTVEATNSDERFSNMTAEFTLTVLDNTDINVDNATDAGYDVTIRVPDVKENYQDEVFESEGELGEFIDFWLDGEKLTRDVDYIAEEGSTKITVRSQTFKSAGSGKHTIAAEFRVNGDTNKPLKRAAQNYELKLKDTSSGGSSSGGSSGGSSSNGSSTGTTTKPIKPIPPVEKPIKIETISTFNDVLVAVSYTHLDVYKRQGL